MIDTSPTGSDQPISILSLVPVFNTWRKRPEYFYPPISTVDSKRYSGCIGRWEGLALWLNRITILSNTLRNVRSMP